MRIFGGQTVTESVSETTTEDGDVKKWSETLKVHILRIFSEKRTNWIIFLITYNSVVIYHLCAWVTSTNSLALRAYTNTVVFNVFSLVTCLISVWVAQNTPTESMIQTSVKNPLLSHSRSYSATGYPEYNRSFRTHHPRHSLSGPCQVEDLENQKNVTDAFTTSRPSLTVFGLEKYEVLALLVFSCLALMAGSLVIVEALSRIADQPSVHTGRLGLGALLGLAAHLGTVWGHKDASLEHVVCKALPCPTLKGYNPILGGNILSATILSGAYVVIHYWDVYTADTAAAFAIVGLTATAMLPLAFYTAGIILQKLPHHMGEQLDKSLREALIIDGVLEFRNERFWTQSFGKLAGSVQVRLRRDVDGVHVLDRVVARLSLIVSSLTVQEFRETQKTTLKTEHCPEYYINELLPNSGEKKSSRSPKSTIDDVQTVRIDDILGVERTPVKTFTVAPNRAPSVNELQGELTNQRTVTIYMNDNVPTKNYVYDEKNENALLMGTKLDVDRFNKCAFQKG